MTCKCGSTWVAIRSCDDTAHCCACGRNWHVERRTAPPSPNDEDAVFRAADLYINARRDSATPWEDRKRMLGEALDALAKAIARATARVCYR